MTTDTLIEALQGSIETLSDGTVVYRNAVGQTHRIDGPAVVYPDGSLMWYRNNRLHREDGAAITYSGGTKAWYQYGRLHRTDGAAVVFPNGEMCWFLNGTEVSEEEFNRRITTGEYRDA